MIILSVSYNKTSRKEDKSLPKTDIVKVRHSHQLDIEDAVAGHAEIEEKEGIWGVLLLEEGEEVAAMQGVEWGVESWLMGGFGETVEFSEEMRVGC